MAPPDDARFITVDGAEGGTGAAPLEFTNHVGCRSSSASRSIFGRSPSAGRPADHVVFVGFGQARLPRDRACSRSASAATSERRSRSDARDWLHPGAGCHTGHCPTGVATQNRWLMRGLDPDLKCARCANYVRALRGELLALSRVDAASAIPRCVTPEHLEIVSERYATARRRGRLRLRPGVARDVARARARRSRRSSARPTTTVTTPGPEERPDRRRRGRLARRRRETSRSCRAIRGPPATFGAWATLATRPRRRARSCSADRRMWDCCDIDRGADAQRLDRRGVSTAAARRRAARRRRSDGHRADNGVLVGRRARPPRRCANTRLPASPTTVGQTSRSCRAPSAGGGAKEVAP